MNLEYVDQSKAIVLIPTFNEIENITILLRKIMQMYPEMALLIVDGHSTDGTVDAVREFMNNYPEQKIYLIEQSIRQGYGKALALGFKEALNKGYDYIITMDGDLSHDPVYIKDFLSKATDFHLIIGSRYLNGVRVEGWQFRKLLFSKLANIYISYLLVRPIWDFTSGYRLYRREFLETINFDDLENYAYLIQVQLIYLAYHNHFHVKEIPILFKDRFPGYSKIYHGAKLKTMLRMLRYRAPFPEILHHLFALKGNYKRFVDEYEEIVNPPRLKNSIHFSKSDRHKISIGILASNEENIIGFCLDALRNQNINKTDIKEIIVVSSGSTDSTDKIVLEYAARDPRIKLISQIRRYGKANAINEFLQHATGDIVILQSADTIADENTVQKLIEPFFNDPEIGMVGAHPVPVNSDKTFIGYCVNKLWQLHHLVAKEQPKCGEMIAFRNIITQIPNYTAVDEAVIESIIDRAGLKLAYAPEAIVHNKGPEKLKDFLKQRRRIAAGHRHLKLTLKHKVATSETKLIIKALLKTQKWTPRQVFYSLFLILIEIYARFMGFIDFWIKNKNPFIWDISLSTKKIHSAQ